MKKFMAMLLALVVALSMLTVAAFAESGDVEEETEDIEVTDPVDDQEEDTNPDTGVAFAVIPMVVAGAAVAFAKKH